MARNVTKNLRQALGAACFRQVLFIVFLIVLTGSARGQNLTSVTADIRRPGDIIRVLLTFDGPVKLSGASFRFNLQKLTEPTQKLWPSYINGSTLNAMSNPNQWEVTGPVQDYTASGEYRLVSVSVSVANLSRDYSAPDTLHQNITLTIINDKKDPIPALKDVTLIPGK
jgi:hypothetical protein